MFIKEYFAEKKRKKERERRKKKYAKIAKLTALGVTTGIVTGKLVSKTEHGKKAGEKIRETTSNLTSQIIADDKSLGKLSRKFKSVKNKITDSKRNVNDYFKKKYHVVDIKVEKKFDTLPTKDETEEQE